jgi:hypothetical protein
MKQLTRLKTLFFLISQDYVPGCSSQVIQNIAVLSRQDKARPTRQRSCLCFRDRSS